MNTEHRQLNLKQIALPPEDVFANVKKIRYVCDQLERFAIKLGHAPRVLDFGCGNGVDLARYIISDQIEYVGVDIHQPSLEYAQKHFMTPHSRFVDQVADDALFDVIIFSEVLEHLDDPAQVLKTYAERLAPGGIVIGSVPNGYGLTEIEKFVDRKLGLYKGLRYLVRHVRKLLGRERPGQEASVPYNHASGHVQFFSKGELRRVAQAAGLDFVDFSHGSIMGADLSAVTILRPRILVEWNTRLADHVPSWAAATWHFVLARETHNE